ncbi:hypothetical protein BCAR13_520276 [Paraburkholderia caribensis]|nr:hypothetical protein BCAR13_520276 [Paraburkholderia caribensis]
MPPMITIFMIHPPGSIVAELSTVRTQPLAQWPEFGLHRARWPQLAGGAHSARAALPIAMLVPDTPPYSVLLDVAVVAAGCTFCWAGVP